MTGPPAPLPIGAVGGPPVFEGGGNAFHLTDPAHVDVTLASLDDPVERGLDVGGQPPAELRLDPAVSQLEPPFQGYRLAGERYPERVPAGSSDVSRYVDGTSAPSSHRST